MTSTTLFTGAVQLLVLLLAVSVHEAAHAWTAQRRGDSTAALLGRATLSPLAHLDLLGSLLLPLLLIAFGLPVFGWGRPTPVVTQNLRRGERDDLLVTAAGSVANATLAVVATIALAVAARHLGPDARQAAYLTLIHDFPRAGALAGFPVMFTLVQMAYVNAFLVLFNLIPLPPLDGGQIALHLLPADWAAKYASLRPYGILVGICHERIFPLV